MFLFVDREVAVVVENLQSKSSGWNFPMSDNQRDAEEWLGAEVETSVEDSLAVRGNDLYLTR